jgi:hypothetical protein
VVSRNSQFFERQTFEELERIDDLDDIIASLQRFRDAAEISAATAKRRRVAEDLAVIIRFRRPIEDLTQRLDFPIAAIIIGRVGAPTT